MSQMLALLGNGQYISGHQVVEEALKVNAVVTGVGVLVC